MAQKLIPAGQVMWNPTTRQKQTAINQQEGGQFFSDQWIPYTGQDQTPAPSSSSAPVPMGIKSSESLDRMPVESAEQAYKEGRLTEDEYLYTQGKITQEELHKRLIAKSQIPTETTPEQRTPVSGGVEEGKLYMWDNPYYMGKVYLYINGSLKHIGSPEVYKAAFPNDPGIQNYILKSGRPQDMGLSLGSVMGSVEDIKRQFTTAGLTMPSQTAQPTAPTPTPTPTASTPGYIIDSNYILVKFSDDPTKDEIDDRDTIWLYDRANKLYQPFVSTQAMANYYKVPLEQIMPKVQTLPSVILTDPTWQGQFVQRKYGIQDDGTRPMDVEIIPETATPATPKTADKTGLDTIYGVEKMTSGVEEEAANFIGKMFTTVKNKGDISEKTFTDNIMNSTQLAKYANAIVYGGYTMADIYRDVKAKELTAQGNTAYASFKGFSDTMPADQWFVTEEGKAIKADANLIPPIEMLGLDADLFKLPIFEIPGKAFTTIIPVLDITSPEFKAEAEKIQAAWYDIMEQQASATTEQQRIIADNNWSMFQSQLKNKYDISLSNNARTAWGQLQDLLSGATGKGLGSSGLYNEAMDKYLAEIRRTNEQLRTEKMTTEDTEQKNFLLTSASADAVAEFIKNNPQKAQMWGLIPSEEVKNFFNTENLKKLYPDLDAKTIENVRNMMLDESGNFRSKLYQTLYTNLYNLGEEKKGYQQSKLQEQKLLEEQKAYAPWTAASPFSSYAPDYAKIEKATGEIKTPSELIPSSLTKIIPPSTYQIPKTTDAAWETFKTAYPAKDWTKYEPISMPTETYKYTDVQRVGEIGAPGAGLYGTLKPGYKSIAPSELTAWETFKKKYPTTDWSSYEPIPGTLKTAEEQKKHYTNIQRVGSSLWGKLTTPYY